MKPNRALMGFLLLLAASSVVFASDDIVIQWNTAMSDSFQTDTAYQNPGMASRTMAMTNVAMYDAINGISPTHQTLYSHGTAPANASAEAAALQAGYRVLSSIYPGLQSQLDSHRDTMLADMTAGPATTAGLQFGDTVGQNVVSQRAADGFTNMVTYMPTNQPGHWQPDPMNPNQSAWGPEWGQISPFAIPSTASFMPDSMPDLTSQAYTDAFNEVKELGALNSATRTDDQTDIALFWAYDRISMGTPMRMYNRILRSVAEDQNNDLAENARLFAMASTAVADAGIVAWDAKFKYDFWRPVTGIRDAANDGNPDTVADPDWVPLGAPGGTLSDGTVINDFTPPFPTYVSGHATFGGALFGTLKEFYGTDEISFSATSDEIPGMVRTYDRFSDAMAENGRSRVYLGIHWDFDDIVARDLGGEVATFVSANHFQPVPEPSGSALAGVAIVMIGLLRRRRR